MGGVPDTIHSLTFADWQSSGRKEWVQNGDLLSSAACELGMIIFGRNLPI